MALLDFYFENLVFLKRNKRNRPVYAEISKKLAGLGISRAVDEVRKKMQNLNRRYREETAKMEASGATVSSWRFYGRMHKIMNDLPDEAYPTIPMNSNNNSSSKINEAIVIYPEIACDGNKDDNSATETRNNLQSTDGNLNENPGQEIVILEDSNGSENPFETFARKKVPRRTHTLVEDVLMELRNLREQNEKSSSELIELMKESLQNDRKMITLFQEQNAILKSMR